MKGFLTFVARFCRRPRLSGWTMHRSGHICVSVPIPHGYKFVTAAVICHVSPDGRHYPLVCTDRTGEERYPSLFRCGVN